MFPAVLVLQLKKHPSTVSICTSHLPLSCVRLMTDTLSLPDYIFSCCSEIAVIFCGEKAASRPANGCHYIFLLLTASWTTEEHKCTGSFLSVRLQSQMFSIKKHLF